MYKNIIVMAVAIFFSMGFGSNMAYAEQRAISFWEMPEEATTSVPFEVIIDPNVCTWTTAQELYICVKRVFEMPDSTGILAIPETPYLIKILPELEEILIDNGQRYGIAREERIGAENSEAKYFAIIWENYKPMN